MTKIYVADDEKNVRELLASFLREEGMEVETFTTGKQLIERLTEAEADLLILDVAMSDAAGFNLIKTIRRQWDLPIILLTARDSDNDFIAAFAAGADDYFTKPFSPLKLTLRVKAILSRQYQLSRQSDPLVYGGLTLSLKDRSAFYQGKMIKLTQLEFKLLKYLLEHKEEAVARTALLTEIWGYADAVETRAADDAIKRLRKKLREAGGNILIETVWGYGFKLIKADLD